MTDEKQQRENFHKQTVLTHSENEPDNYPGGHVVEVGGYSFPPERLFPAKNPS
jgi:hypothetical protein